ncbi:MAG: ATP-binding protein [Tahibacter sp.]
MSAARVHEGMLEPAALARTLAWLRVFAVLGQTAAVVFVAGWLGLPLPLGGLIGGIASLAAFAGLVLWRLRMPWPVSAGEILAHVGFDTAVLGWLLYLTGGASNPFVTLLLMPITLAATALGQRTVFVVGLLCTGTYLCLLYWYVPLPGVHMHVEPSGFGLHIAGMTVSFAISAALLGAFIGRLARGLRNQQGQIQRTRERALRDEGILAIATQAAGAAHELNTPLSTMRILLTELQREHRGGALAADLDLLAGQVQRCSDSLRELVAVGKAQLDGTPEAIELGPYIEACLERFRLLRPEIEVSLRLQGGEGKPLRVPAGLRHALMNLMNNAADASLCKDSQKIELDVRCDADTLRLCITDHGGGLTNDAAGRTPTPFHSTKHDGLGIGLALADATAERLGGRLTLDSAADGGTATRLDLPLHRLGGMANAS